MGATLFSPQTVMTTDSHSRFNPLYIGRFAPSPSGPLHFGSLVSALASYLDAKAHHGKWLVRMEDIDPPREMEGAADTILQQLQHHGLHWDDEVLYQSQRSKAYLTTLEHLQQLGHIYPCQCSRQQLKDQGGIHAHPCRQHNPTAPAALRLSVSGNSQIKFDDLFQGSQQQDIQCEVGDMVLYRKEGLFAYQLAVVVDDAFQQITHVIRGSDLLNSTPRQIYLQRFLELPTPLYGHIPVATHKEGGKLSKQNLALPIDNHIASENLTAAIRWLGLPLPETLLRPTNSPHTHCDELLAWAIEHWQRGHIPSIMEKLASS